MLIIHADGKADVLRLETEDFLSFARILTDLAGQFIAAYQAAQDAAQTEHSQQPEGEAEQP